MSRCLNISSLIEGTSPRDNVFSQLFWGSMGTPTLVKGWIEFHQCYKHLDLFECSSYFWPFGCQLKLLVDRTNPPPPSLSLVTRRRSFPNHQEIDTIAYSPIVTNTTFSIVIFLKPPRYRIEFSLWLELTNLVDNSALKITSPIGWTSVICLHADWLSFSATCGVSPLSVSSNCEAAAV